MEMDRFAEHVRRVATTTSGVADQLSEVIRQMSSLTSRIESASEGMQAQALGAKHERERAIARFRAAFDELPAREQRVAVLLHVNNLTLRETGEILGVSESRVCQIHGAMKKTLRRALADDETLFQLVA